MRSESLGSKLSQQWQVLRGSELEFRRLLDTLPAGAYICDPKGLITYFNRQATLLWGREPRLNDAVDRFCGSFKLYATDGTPITHDRCWMARALESGQEFNGCEILVERPDGSRLTALAHANPLHDDEGNLLGAVNVLVDISDRKRADEAQRLLASIVESSDDAIVSKTLEGRILSWNRGAERLFGYSSAEAIGSPITLIIPPERLDEEQAILERIGRGERIEHFETVRVDKQGRPIAISLTISPIRDELGRVVGASKVARDISQRKQDEAAVVTLKDEMATQLADLRRLHELSVRLSTTLELQPILDETLRTATALQGTDMGLLSLCDEEHDCLTVRASMGLNADFLQFIECAPPGGGACGASYQQRRRVVVDDIDNDPTFEPYREAARQAGFRAVHCTPLINRLGKVIGVLSVQFRQPRRPTDREIHLVDLCARHAVDHIENAKLYGQLIEQDRRKDEFLATLAHELRNPLAPISNSLEILRLSDDLSPAVLQVRDIMERQVDHMVRLVDDLLEVSRITRGKIEIRKEPVELAAVVRAALETSRPLIEAAHHQLAISIQPEPITLSADAVRLAQVVSNLLNNAAKYTEPGGQIWLAARREAGEAVVSVRDTGLGIAAEMLPKVFDMFAQINRTLNLAQGGLGIGLNLAKNLVALHGGRIEAKSAGPGQGSEFIVRLPLAHQDAAHDDSAGERAPALDSIDGPPHNEANALETRRILVVDDTRAAVFTLGKLLQKLGQQVRTADGGEAALVDVRYVRPDVIISDIAMPGMDGYELARRLRREPGLKNVTLVALTGYGQDSDRQLALDAGFDHHLVKPVSVAALRELLASLASNTATSGQTSAIR